MTALATVASCSTTACSFNDGGCNAFAITMGGNNGVASCSTFITLDARGGLTGANSQVGACQRLECTHNNDLMCAAKEITVSGDNAACELYAIA